MKIVYTIFAVFLMVMAGCSSGRSFDTVSPGEPVGSSLGSLPAIGLSEASDTFNAIGLMGVFNLSVDTAKMSAELTSKRFNAIGEDYIVSGIGFFTIRPCADCFKLKSIKLTDEGLVELGFEVKHPFQPGNPSNPPSGINRLDLDVFDLAVVMHPLESTSTNYTLTGKTIYSSMDNDCDGYTTELANVISDQAALPYWLVIDDSISGTSTWNKFAMGASATVNVRPASIDVPGRWNFDTYLTMGYGASAKKAQRLTPTYYNPEFNRKAAWKVIATPPSGTETPSMTNTWNDIDNTTTWNVKVEVYDWQQGATVDPTLATQDVVYAASNVSNVSVEIPGMNSTLQSVSGSTGTGTGMPGSPLVFNVPIANANLLPAGIYTGLVKVADERVPLTPTDGRDFLIDTPDGVALNNYSIPEYATYQTFKATVVIGNQPPIIDSGVDGNDQPFVLATETYTVTAHDTDPGDMLSYSWTVTDVATSAPVISNNPGNGDGTIDINFPSLGVA